ncbi:hypothetical protein AGLY_009760 [Aphis glycines]|uniref:Uncharacterized protein n=1 Tax=Aphis glycines TaxID=307491 RepID=A0A6G0THD2_APHGL|nr:hypothetical protein AGLY_009760 [Aphis glycines]
MTVEIFFLSMNTFVSCEENRLTYLKINDLVKMLFPSQTILFSSGYRSAVQLVAIIYVLNLNPMIDTKTHIIVKSIHSSLRSESKIKIVNITLRDSNISEEKLTLLAHRIRNWALKYFQIEANDLFRQNSDDIAIILFNFRHSFIVDLLLIVNFYLLKATFKNLEFQEYRCMVGGSWNAFSIHIMEYH